MTLKEVLSKRRKELKMTKADVAKKANIPYTTYDGYERGDRLPSFIKMIVLAKALDITPLELAADEPDLQESAYMIFGEKKVSDAFIDEMNKTNSDTVAKLNQLNRTGQDKANDYVTDLTKIIDYTKKER